MLGSPPGNLAESGCPRPAPTSSCWKAARCLSRAGSKGTGRSRPVRGDSPAARGGAASPHGVAGRMRQSAAAGRADGHVGPDRYRRDPARQGGPGSGRGAPWRERRPRAVDPQGSVCRPGRARPIRGALARHAVLHLARGHDRVPDVRRGVESRRAGRARADALRRQRNCGSRSHDRRPRRPPQHRGAALEPVHEPRAEGPRLSHRLQASEPAHAQQVVHRGQPGDDRRRPQHRRRLLRRRCRNGVRRPRRRGGGSDRGRSRGRVRSLLEQRFGLPGGGDRPRGGARRRCRDEGEVRRGRGVAGGRRVHRGRARHEAGRGADGARVATGVDGGTGDLRRAGQDARQGGGVAAGPHPAQAGDRLGRIGRSTSSRPISFRERGAPKRSAGMSRAAPGCAF